MFLKSQFNPNLMIKDEKTLMSKIFDDSVFEWYGWSNQYNRTVAVDYKLFSSFLDGKKNSKLTLN